MYPIVCADIDGTLINSAHKLSARTASVLGRLAGSGITFVPASARMPASIAQLFKSCLSNYPIISYNGALVVADYAALPKQQYLANARLAPATTAHIVQAAQKLGIHAGTFVYNQWFVPSMDQWAQREAQITGVMPTVMPVEALLNNSPATAHGAHKVMCMGNAPLINQLQQQLMPLAGHVNLYRAGRRYLEITTSTTNKGQALATVAAHLSLTPKQAVAFGDNVNDVELLQLAGLGIAVSNARPQAKAAASQLTAASHLDGVAQCLEQLYFPTQ